MNLPSPPLILITDRKTVPISLESTLQRAFDGGCRWVMVREKDLSSDERMKLVEAALKLGEPYDATIVVNSDLKAGEIAHGVHLPQGQSCTKAREVLGPEKIIGVSAHTLGEAGVAGSAGADFATLSPIFPTQSKSGYGPPIYPDGLKKITSTLKLPLIALGGVTAATAQSCRRAGAAGVAVMGTVMRASDPAVAVLEILNQWYEGVGEDVEG